MGTDECVEPVLSHQSEGGVIRQVVGGAKLAPPTTVVSPLRYDRKAECCFLLFGLFPFPKRADRRSAPTDADELKAACSAMLAFLK